MYNQLERENSYDILRIASTIAVISIHVSAVWLSANTSDAEFGTMYHTHLITTCLWNVMARFAVPCFMMMSGALLLSNERNRDYSFFYKKQFHRIGIPALVFIILYLLYGLLTTAAAVLVKGRDMAGLLQPLQVALTGDSHLWYLYAMAGVYLLVPILIRLKGDIGEKRFGCIAWMFLVLASIGYMTSKRLLMWDIGFQFRFTGYFMAGYVIRRMINGRKSNPWGLLYIWAGGGILCIVTFIRYRQEVAGIGEDALPVPVVSALCPWIIVASLCIFTGFSLLNVHHDYSGLASGTFFIYLIHAGIWDFLFRIIRKVYGAEGDSRILIPLSILCVFMVSLALYVGWKVLYKGIKKKKSALE